MAQTPAERMRRYRARKSGGKTEDGKNINKSAKLYLDEETQELISLLKCDTQNENLEQLFKRALFALSQNHFDALLTTEFSEEAAVEDIEVSTETEDTLLTTMNQLQGKILLLESEYITPLKETVKQLQKKKAELLQHIDKLKGQNKRLRKTALHYRQQRDEALKRTTNNDDAIEIEGLLVQMMMPEPGRANSKQRQTFLCWLKAQRKVPYTWQEIANALNQSNISTPSGKSQWNSHLLRSLLKRGYKAI